MNVLTVERLAKSYSEKNLFNDISLSINDGEKIGLVGINGTGKSTLLKVIAGLEPYDAGKILYRNSLKIEYLPQNPIFESGTTILDHVFKGSSPVMTLLRAYELALRETSAHPGDEQLAKRLIGLSQKMDIMAAWSIETEVKSILTRLGIDDFSADVGKLSGGQRKRVAIASALISPADLLILDEPTNHIDSDTVDWLEKYLNKRNGALLMVTHDRYLLDRIANRMLELDDGKLYSYQPANYSKYLELKAERVEQGEANERKRQGLIRRELEWIRRGARARSTKQKARIDRFERLTGEQSAVRKENLDIQAGFSRLGKKIISLEGVSKSFSCGEIIKNFSYNLLRDDRVGIIGPNGSGKSTLMKIFSGSLKPDTGTVSIGETVKIGYFSQENDGMDTSSMRVIEYIREQAEWITTENGTVSASQMLERFLFPPSVQWTPVSKLSGGEKRRLYLLRILMGAPNILMLDEPTNDLDIQTLSILEEYIEEFPGAVIAVSHDRYFLDRVAGNILSFEGEGRIKPYNGNYSDYRDCVLQEPAEIPMSSPTKPKMTEKTEKTDKKDKPLKFTFKEQREFDQIDGIIAALESDLSRASAQMKEAESDYQRLQQLMAEKEQLEAQLDSAINRWAYLNELHEEIERNKKPH